jgi:hypothetical protein
MHVGGGGQDYGFGPRAITLYPTMTSMSSKPGPVTPGAILYWLGMAVLLIGVVTIVWKVVNPPQTLGI